MPKKKKVENTEKVNGLCNTNNDRKKTKIPLIWVSEIKQAKRVANHFNNEEYLIRKIS